MQAFITIVTAVLSLFAPVNNHTYVLTGNYLEYGVINTVDGNDWLLYGHDDNDCKFYPDGFDIVLSDGDLVQIRLDNMGTADIRDDEIIDIRMIRDFD